jgi:hypothetical protein
MVSIGVVVIFVARFKFSQLEVFLHYSTPTQAHMEELKKQRDIWKPYKHNNLLARISKKNSHFGCLKHVYLTSACEQMN